MASLERANRANQISAAAQNVAVRSSSQSTGGGAGGGAAGGGFWGTNAGVLGELPNRGGNLTLNQRVTTSSHYHICARETEAMVAGLLPWKVYEVICVGLDVVIHLTI